MPSLPPMLPNLPPQDPGLPLLLEWIRQEHALDCGQYKQSFLYRRLAVRQRATHQSTLTDYYLYLKNTPDEFERLIEALSINLTYFFRDLPVYATLRDLVLPAILTHSDAAAHRHLRCWSAGCASGEEAYSLAMLIDTRLGEEANQWRIQILATDLDEDALNKGRRAVYGPLSFHGQTWTEGPFSHYFINVSKDSKNAVGAGPAGLPVNARNFPQTSPGLGERAIIPRLRAWTHFLRHDLMADALPPPFDLILCRNVLIYFTREQQEKLYQRFYQALKSPGYLVIGKTETLSHAGGQYFQAVDLRQHIFQKRL